MSEEQEFKLKIGDLVYHIDNNSFEIQRIYKVVKITKSLAVLDNGERFKINYNKGFSLTNYPKSTDIYRSYKVETEELKELYKMQKNRERIIGHCKKIERDISLIHNSKEIELIKDILYSQIIKPYFEGK